MMEKKTSGEKSQRKRAKGARTDEAIQGKLEGVGRWDMRKSVPEEGEETYLYCEGSLANASIAKNSNTPAIHCCLEELGRDS